MSTRFAGRQPRALLAAVMLCMAGCTAESDDRAVRVDVIGEPEHFAKPLAHDGSPAAQLLLAATAQGLLTFNATGHIVGGLAESWIVEDGGQSYIFRLKRLHWPDREPLRAEQVARLLRERMRANPLALAGLEPEVRAMTDRVIEIRLGSSLPAFLQLLAQPELAILSRAGGTGPYQATTDEEGAAITLTPAAFDDALEVEEEEEIPAQIERRTAQANRAALALVRFRAGYTDLVLGGRFQHLPLIEAVGLDRSGLQLDPVEGLFGLAIVGSSDFLDDVPVRDALARVIDRTAIVEALGMPGWRTAAYPLPASYELGRLPSAPAWSGRSPEDRIESATRIIERWRADHGDPPMLRIALPEGPGASVLFLRLVRDFAQIGLRIDRVALDETADLRLIDEVAPFDSAFWYLARLDCEAGLRCDPRVAPRLEAARAEQDETERARLLAEAEEATVSFVGFIPIGRPIRWSVAGQRLTGFAPSPRGVHPLNALIAAPN